MGKIIGIGGGFNDEDEAKLAKDIMEMTGKAAPNYLQIPTTGYDSPDIHSVAYYSKMGCCADILYLTHAYVTEEIIRQKIENADMIYVPGGNLKFALDTWRRTGADKHLKKAFDDGKVLFGSSSGSMCWFRQGFDDCGPEDSFMFVDALGLLPYNNVPHYEGAFWQTFNEYANKPPFSISTASGACASPPTAPTPAYGSLTRKTDTGALTCVHAPIFWSGYEATGDFRKKQSK